MNKSKSIPKNEGNFINEDSAKSTSNYVAVADGAGGGGLYADKWSAYLLEHLPDTPLDSYNKLNEWIDAIWENFYNKYENEAQKSGGMLLDKFYQEGSFSTLAAAWKISNKQCIWVTYGDSVVFHYNKKSKLLEHTFTSLSDFDTPPFLINCKDPLAENGFKSGTFNIDEHSIIIAATDALSHYILMMYMVIHKEKYQTEIEAILASQTKSSKFLRVALSLNKKKQANAISRLLNSFREGKEVFKEHLMSLEKKQLIAHDDYSLSIMN